jgi:hypothetical protein
MTEAEYRTISGTSVLPLLNDWDESCEEQLLRVHDTRYTGELKEEKERGDAIARLNDKSWELSGGIRYSGQDDDVDDVRAIFWKKRDAEPQL